MTVVLACLSVWAAMAAVMAGTWAFQRRAGNGQPGQRHCPKVPDHRRVHQQVQRLGNQHHQRRQREPQHLPCWRRRLTGHGRRG